MASQLVSVSNAWWAKLLALSVCLLVTVIRADDEGGLFGQPKMYDDDEPLTAHVSDFGFKVICEEEEAKEQFLKYRYQLAKCLKFTAIYLTHQEVKVDPANPLASVNFARHKIYCRLARHWHRCSHLMDEAYCFMPDAAAMTPHQQGAPNSMTELLKTVIKPNPDWPAHEDHLNSMVHPYKLMCELMKANYQNMMSSLTGPNFFGPEFEKQLKEYTEKMERENATAAAIIKNLTTKAKPTKRTTPKPRPEHFELKK